MEELSEMKHGDRTVRAGLFSKFPQMMINHIDAYVSTSVHVGMYNHLQIETSTKLSINLPHFTFP